VTLSVLLLLMLGLNLLLVLGFNSLLMLDLNLLVLDLNRCRNDGTNEKTGGGKNDDVRSYIGWLCFPVKNQPLKLSKGASGLWIPVKRMISSVSRGPSVSLNFGVFGTEAQLRF
jgi:hypothetical protein